MSSRSHEAGGRAEVGVQATAWGQAPMPARMDSSADGAPGTTVFVGRASFRMVPKGVDLLCDDEPLSGTPLPLLAEAESPWFAPSERVVLLPPESLVLAAKSAATAQSSQAAEGATLLPESEELTGRFDVQRKAAGRPSMPLWAIAVALAVGATTTLSAQAFMRRASASAETRAPAQATGAAELSRTVAMHEPAAKPIPVAATPPETAAASEAASATTAIAAGPTVVQSTASVPTIGEAAPAGVDFRPAPSPTSHNTTAIGGARRAVERAVVAPTGSKSARVTSVSRPAAVTPTPTTTTKTSTTWVDPFVGDSASAWAGTERATTARKGLLRASDSGAQVTNKRTTASFGGATKSVDTAWVDPFAN